MALPKKESFTHQFFVDKILEDFDKELAETRPKKRARGIFFASRECANASCR
jgi:hypothetical protein